jgi:hypothetical protein
MKHIVLLSIIITISCMQCGCALLFVPAHDIKNATLNNKSCWPNEPNTYKQPLRVIDKTAAVLPFGAESRPLFPLSPNDVFLGLIPGVLFVSGEYEPDFGPQFSFALALTTELQVANVFRDVSFNDTTGNSDFIVSGTVLDVARKETIFMYGVSVLAAPLWFILPMGSFSNDLSVQITCTDVKTGNLIFSKVYTGPEYHEVIWLYFIKPKKCNYGEMIQGIYKQFVEELRAKLAESMVTTPAEQVRP